VCRQGNFLSSFSPFFLLFFSFFCACGSRKPMARKKFKVCATRRKVKFSNLASVRTTLSSSPPFFPFLQRSWEKIVEIAVSAVSRAVPPFFFPPPPQRRGVENEFLGVAIWIGGSFGHPSLFFFFFSSWVCTARAVCAGSASGRIYRYELSRGACLGFFLSFFPLEDPWRQRG